MGRVLNAEVAARKRAQQRMAALRADRAERDQRIEDAVAAVFAAADRREAASERRGLAVAAARAAIADAEQAERDAAASADDAVAGCVVSLRAEGLTAVEICDLVAVPVAEVRRMLRAAAQSR